MNNRGFSVAILLILIGLVFIGFAILQFFNPFKKNLAPPTNRDYRVSTDDISDQKYDLVKDMYSLSPEQLEILSTVNEDDKEL